MQGRRSQPTRTVIALSLLAVAPHLRPPRLREQITAYAVRPEAFASWPPRPCSCILLIPLSAALPSTTAPFTAIPSRNQQTDPSIRASPPANIGACIEPTRPAPGPRLPPRGLGPSPGWDRAHWASVRVKSLRRATVTRGRTER